MEGMDRAMAEDPWQLWYRILAHEGTVPREKGPFKDWEHERKREFVLELLQSMKFKDRRRMLCASLTVDLAEYRRVALCPDVKPPEAVCVDFCLSHLFSHP